jgi:hypothetical protein
MDAGENARTGQTLMLIVVFTLTQPLASVAFTTTAEPVLPLVAALGVPLTTPAELRDKPVGQVPLTVVHV